MPPRCYPKINWESKWVAKLFLHTYLAVCPHFTSGRVPLRPSAPRLHFATMEHLAWNGSSGGGASLFGISKRLKFYDFLLPLQNLVRSARAQSLIFLKVMTSTIFGSLGQISFSSAQPKRSPWQIKQPQKKIFGRGKVANEASTSSSTSSPSWQTLIMGRCCFCKLS